MHTLGIDYGKNGGFALLGPQGELAAFLAMPTHKEDKGIDHAAIENFYEDCRLIICDDTCQVFAENVGGRGGNSAVSMYSFGRNNGYVDALTHTWFGREIKVVTPRTWQKWLFNDQSVPEKVKSNKRDTKLMALLAVTKIYPNCDLRRTQRSRIFHDGTVDAVGIAYWGMKVGK